VSTGRPLQPPQAGDIWRVNFSRVERQGDINWTWQSQVRWDPSSRQFRGFVDMHMPDAWGYLYFWNEGENDTMEVPRDVTWPARLTAMVVYYAQHYHKDKTGSFTDVIDALILPHAITEPFDVSIQVGQDNQAFIVTVRNPTNSIVATVTDDRLLRVDSSSGSDDLRMRGALLFVA
jgi:hypothetical protein